MIPNLGELVKNLTPTDKVHIFNALFNTTGLAVLWSMRNALKRIADKLDPPKKE